MLDIRFIREHPNEVQDAANAKRIPFSVDELLEVDMRRRKSLHQVEELRRARNLVSAQIARAIKEDSENPQMQQHIQQLKKSASETNALLAACEAKYTDVNTQYGTLMLRVPNIISPDTPHGDSDADNVELERVGQPVVFDYVPKDHVELGEALDLMDIPRGVKVAGSRGYFLKNGGLYLHRAVQQLAIDLLVERGFTIMDVPVMVAENALLGTGFFPVGREMTYELPLEDRWLVGTSEVPLVSYFAGEVLDVREPVRLAGVSNCFRREAGSAGRDTRGLYRVHQFAKVEQVVLCQNDLETSLRVFEEITQNARDILEKLELPYRVVSVCTGDLSQKNYKQYDIETWMPSRNNYGETHSSSILLDFQARRSDIRYRDEAGDLQYCHTLNNTAIASPRILIPLLENHQRPDGTIYIPKALRPYMNGMTFIGRNRMAPIGDEQTLENTFAKSGEYVDGNYNLRS